MTCMHLIELDEACVECGRAVTFADSKFADNREKGKGSPIQITPPRPTIMNRDIEVRLWDRELGIWSSLHVAGLLISANNVIACLHSERFDITQYVGMKDRNGKKIFEGDFVAYWEHQHYGQRSERIGKVILVEYIVAYHNVGFTIKAPKNGGPSNWEVLGNIFENPELQSRVSKK